jgi:hypothetical protein
MFLFEKGGFLMEETDGSIDSLSIGKRKKKLGGSLFVATGFIIGVILLSTILYVSSFNPGIYPLASYTFQQSSTTTNYTLTITSMSQGKFRPAGIEDARLLAYLSGINMTYIPFTNISGVWDKGAMFKDKNSDMGLSVGDVLYLEKGWLFNAGTIIMIMGNDDLIGKIILA